MQHPAIGHDDAKSAVTFREMRTELALAPMITMPDDKMSVVNAATRFVARGGCWTPSLLLARRLDEAALGRVDYVRL